MLGLFLLPLSGQDLVVTSTLDSYEIWSSDYQRLAPLEFGQQVGDQAMVQRYRGIWGLTKPSSVLLWAGGSIVSYSACLTTLAWQGGGAQPLAQAIPAAYCGLGLTMVVSGFGLYQGGRRTLNRYDTWWSEPQARALAEDYNRSR